MIIHFVLLAYIIIAGIAIYNSKRKISQLNRLFVTLSFMGIFLIQALRAKTVGWDTEVYYRSYYRTATVNNIFDYRWEPLFVLLNKISYSISDDPQMLFILSAAIINLSLGSFVLDNSDDSVSAFWMVFLYTTLTGYFNSMNLLRQFLAISISIHSYTLLRKSRSLKSYIIALLLIVTGFFFHRTALVYLIIPLVMSLRRVGYKHMFIIFVLTIVLSLLVDRLTTVIMQLFPVYRKYLESYLLEGYSASGYHFVVATAKAIMVLFALQKPIKKAYKGLENDVVFCIISIAATVLRLRISFAVRTGYYFDTIALVFMAKMPAHLQWKNRRLVYTLLFVLGTISFTYLLISENGSRGCAQYTFFWQ